MPFNLIETLSRLRRNRDAHVRPLIKQLEYDYSEYFILSLEALSEEELNTFALKNFLEKHFHLFKHTVFCMFSRPYSIETGALLEIASYCSTETGQDIYTFLLPGVTLSSEQRSSSSDNLLSGHILSDCAKKLICSNSLFLPQPPNLSITELFRLKNHSRDQQQLHEINRLVQAPHTVVLAFLGRVEELIVGLQQPESAREALVDFKSYYEICLSAELLQFVPTSLQNALTELVETLFHQYIQSLSTGLPVIINPTLLANVINVYTAQLPYLKEQAMSSSPVLTLPNASSIRTTDFLKKWLMQKYHINTLNGIITADLLQTINANFKIRTVTDLRILEHIPPAEFAKIITTTQLPSPFQAPVNDTINHFTARSLLLFLSRLTPEQVESFCQTIPASQWARILSATHNFYFFLWFFHHEEHLVQAFVSGIAHALPSLIEIFLKQRDIKLAQLFGELGRISTIQRLIENALVQNMAMFSKRSYFYDFLKLPNMAKTLNLNYWLISFRNDPRAIAIIFPTLPPVIKKNILQKLIPLITTRRLLLRDFAQVFICITETHGLQMFREYSSFLDLFKKTEWQQELCHLLGAPQYYSEFLKNIVFIFQKVYQEKSVDFASFFKEALKISETRNQILSAELLPNIIKFLKINCFHSLSDLFDEIASEILLLPTEKTYQWNPEIFQDWLKHEQLEQTNYQNIHLLPPSLLQYFYGNTAEHATLIVLLKQHGLIDLGVFSYQNLIATGLENLEQKFFQESSTPQSFLLTLERVGAMIGECFPADYDLFFAQVLLPCAALNDHLFIELSADMLLRLINCMAPRQSVLFTFTLIRSPSFKLMNDSVIALLFSEGRKIGGANNTLVRAVGTLTQEQRAKCFNTIKSINLTCDLSFIITMQDLSNYLNALGHHYSPSIFVELGQEFFSSPQRMKHLVSQPSDWILWFKIIAPHFMEKAFLAILKTELLSILPVLNDHVFREACNSVNQLQLIAALREGNYSDKVLITALISLGFLPEQVLTMVPSISGQNFSLRAHAALVFDSLKVTQSKSQYYWSCFFIKNYFNETAKTILSQRFRQQSLARGISHMSKVVLTDLLNTHQGYESIVISILIKMGLSHSMIASFMCKLPIETYLATWQDFERKLPARDFHESFFTIHELLEIDQLQCLNHAIYSSNNIRCYEKYFPLLLHAAKMFQHDRSILGFFPDKQALFCLIKSSTVPDSFRNMIIRLLLEYSTHGVIAGFGFTQEEFIEVTRPWQPQLQDDAHPVCKKKKHLLFTEAASLSDIQSEFISATTSYSSSASSILSYSQSETESCSKKKV